MRLRIIELAICVCCVIAITSCIAFDKEANHIGTVDLLELIDEAEEFKLSQLANGHEFIILETTDSSLLGTPGKMIYSSGDIYIQSRSVVYRFGYNGIFKNVIGKRGRGPGEYGSLRDFDISENNSSLAFLTSPGGKVLIFDKTGVLKTTFPTDQKALNIAYTDDLIMTYSDNTSVSAEHSFCFYTAQGENLICMPGHYPYVGEVSLVVSIFNPAIFFEFGGKHYVREWQGDTVYLIEGTDIKPWMILSSGEKRYTATARTEGKETQDYLIVNNISATKNFLMIKYSLDGSGYLIIYEFNKGENKAVKLSNGGIVDDIVAGRIVRDFFPTGAGDTISYFISPSDYNGLFKTHPEFFQGLKPPASEIGEMSNPVIVRVNLIK